MCGTAPAETPCTSGNSSPSWLPTTDCMTRPTGTPTMCRAGLAGMVGQRLSRLDRPSRRALAAAAVIGAEFDIADLADVVDLSVSTVRARLRPAYETGLLDEVADRPGCYRFGHGLLHDAVLAQVPGAERAGGTCGDRRQQRRRRRHRRLRGRHLHRRPRMAGRHRAQSRDRTGDLRNRDPARPQPFGVRRHRHPRRTCAAGMPQTSAQTRTAATPGHAMAASGRCSRDPRRPEQPGRRRRPSNARSRSANTPAVGITTARSRCSATCSVCVDVSTKRRLWPAGWPRNTPRPVTPISAYRVTSSRSCCTRCAASSTRRRQPPEP